MDSLPFSDKYRPTNLEELVLDDIICKKITNIIENKTIPNIIFTGKSGVGKTSAIHCIAKMIYPKEYHESIIELNASDDRGIKTVQETIINFCKRKIEFHEEYAQHKLLILDEADNITSKAQRLINSIMEKYPLTKFAFTCNDSSKIIESIQSRCLIIKFSKPPIENFILRIKYICANENIEYDEEALYYLFKICQKDLRKTLNMLEMVYRSENKITIANIDKVSDIPSENVLELLLENIIKKDYKNICKLIKNFEIQGYYSLDILLHFIQFIKNYRKFSAIEEDIRINLINKLSNKSYVMSKTINDYLQLTGAILSCVEM